MSERFSGKKKNQLKAEVVSFTSSGDMPRWMLVMDWTRRINLAHF
jgi:hypothetical protein